ncbi:retrovirus-related pol polyprotein from [Plakobranchus ocellatus]|uniref:Retrovirus-related pol polyprotein from n=1 Tax=Plakobranchus ocellatus TaxID=259542 RepID=A0AAV3ZKE8_9GAST|nr:retrovirus-related pol polyprotein from [Plakobranchus ocellatus]
MMRLDPPHKFSFRPEEWPEWSMEFKRFRTAGKLHLEDGEIQRDTLIYCMGQEAEKIYRTLQFDEEDSIIRDRFVVGLTDQKLKEKLQLIHDLTLKKALETARQHELIKSQMKAQAVVDLVSKNNSKASSNPKPRPGSNLNQRAACGRCGRQHGPRQCPAYGKECMKCGGRNHFAKVCHTKPHTEGQRKNKPKYNQKPTSWRSSNQNTRGKQIHEVTDEARETLFIDTVKKKTSEPSRILLSITHLVDDKKTDADFKIDTGADVNIINKQTWLSLGKPQLLEGNINLSSPGGVLEVKGKFEAEIKGVKTYIYVIGNNVDNLLSRDTASALKLIKRVDQVKFNMVKCMPVKIKVKDDVTPYIDFNCQESANSVTEQSQERARENERTRHHRRNYRTN